MKKASKLIAVLSVFVIIVSVFCACEISFGDEKTTTTTEPETYIADDFTENQTKSTKPSETTSSSTSKKVETDSLETILHNIKDYQPGTAGSTTKGYEIAYKLLNFTQNSNFTINDAKQDYQFFLSSLDDNDKLLYEENFPEVDYFARNVIENPDILKNYIEDYKPISEDGEISLANYEALYVIISK